MEGFEVFEVEKETVGKWEMRWDSKTGLQRRELERELDSCTLEAFRGLDSQQKWVEVGVEVEPMRRLVVALGRKMRELERCKWEEVVMEGEQEEREKERVEVKRVDRESWDREVEVLELGRDLEEVELEAEDKNENGNEQNDHENDHEKNDHENESENEGQSCRKMMPLERRRELKGFDA